jgi:hypothetical protein
LIQIAIAGAKLSLLHNRRSNEGRAMKRFILAFLLSAGTLASFQAAASDLGFVGAVEGAIVGSHFGGAHGAVAGAVIGAAIGSSAQPYDYRRSYPEGRYAPAPVYAPVPVYGRERVYAPAPVYAYNEPIYEPYYEPAPAVYVRTRAYPVYAAYPAYPAYPVIYRTSVQAYRYAGSNRGHYVYRNERRDNHRGQDRR